MDLPVSMSSSMDFSTFVQELNQSSQLDCGTGGGGSSSRNCYPSDSRLSQEFESSMQKLLSNYDLDEAGDVAMAGIPAPRLVNCDSDPNDNPINDSALSMDNESLNESLATTVDNEDDPLELTGDDSGDAGDGGSSDEQQHSRSLSLSYSLSISHAQENFSQYSQSTDKGLSKRYDSPCSYEEDDRESECTNFDKLDDWNDFISDMHNNNNNNGGGGAGGDNANRDFREYYDEYLACKGLAGKNCELDASGECSTRETDEDYQETLLESREGGIILTSEPEDPHQQGAAFHKDIPMAEKCRSFLEYRNPSSEMDDEPMGTDDNFNSTALDRYGTASSVSSGGKRKFCYADNEDVNYEVTELITEKFRKTDEVPDHGSHAPISLIDDEQFARLIQIESPSKTPIPGNAEERNNNGNPDSSNDSMQEILDRVDDESTVATTPTNASCMQQMFEAFEHGESVDRDSSAALKKKQLKNVSTRKCAIRKTNNEYPATPFHHFERSNLNLDLAIQPNSDATDSH